MALTTGLNTKSYSVSGFELIDSKTQD